MLARRLRKGDIVGIISPANPITEDLQEQFNSGIKFLEDLGLKVVIAENALKNTLGYSLTAQEKAEDINNMFKDKSVSAIFYSQGGWNTNSVLPYLDYQLIKNNPKILLGISDATVLLNAIYAKTGLITFHATDVIWGFGMFSNEFGNREFVQRLFEGKVGEVNKNSEWKCIKEGIAEGVLVGGNLNCLSRLVNTQYLNDLRDKILFIEDLGEETPPEGISCLLHHLKQCGVFEKISGLWIGYYNHPSRYKIEDILNEIIDECNFPILQCNDFGHEIPNIVIPIGAKVKMDATSCEVTILEKCVV